MKKLRELFGSVTAVQQGLIVAGVFSLLLTLIVLI